MGKCDLRPGHPAEPIGVRFCEQQVKCRALRFSYLQSGGCASPTLRGSPVLVRKGGETKAVQRGIRPSPEDAGLKSRYLLVGLELRSPWTQDKWCPSTDMPRDRNK